MISEREAVLREREAFVKGALRDSLVCRQTAIRIAASEFPLPKVTRPRVVCDSSGFEWAWNHDGSMLVSRAPQGEWTWKLERLPITPERMTIFADLLANPTEEVDADA